ESALLLVVRYPRDRRLQTRPFVQSHPPRRVRHSFGESWVEGLVHRRPAVDFASPRRRRPFPLRRMATAAHRPRRVAPRPATLAALKAQRPPAAPVVEIPWVAVQGPATPHGFLTPRAQTGLSFPAR